MSRATAPKTTATSTFLSTTANVAPDNDSAKPATSTRAAYVTNSVRPGRLASAVPPGCVRCGSERYSIAVLVHGRVVWCRAKAAAVLRTVPHSNASSACTGKPMRPCGRGGACEQRGARGGARRTARRRRGWRWTGWLLRGSVRAARQGQAGWVVELVRPGFALGTGLCSWALSPHQGGRAPTQHAAGGTHSTCRPTHPRTLDACAALRRHAHHRQQQGGRAKLGRQRCTFHWA